MYLNRFNSFYVNSKHYILMQHFLLNTKLNTFLNFMFQDLGLKENYYFKILKYVV